MSGEMKANENVKVPMIKKICYGSGAAGGNVMSTLLATFLLSYYTDTAMLNAAAVATMFLVCRIFDGITDVIMGGIVDKTNTKLGKARPWLLLSAPLMVVGIILILSVPAGWSDSMKLVYAYVTYLFLNAVVYTIFGIAHMALMARITRDPNERNTMSVVSSICNGLSGLIVGTAITAFVMHFGWSMTGVILGVISGSLILVPGLTLKENIGMTDHGVDQREVLPMKQQLPAVLTNKYFYLALLIGAFTLLMNANAIASQVFYCNVVMQDPAFMMQMMAFGQAPGIVVLLIMPWFSKKFSKRAFMAIGCGILILSFIVLGFAGTNHSLLILGTILRSIGVGPIFAGIYALIADAVDYGEWKTGIRSEGLMSASQSIGSKIGIGFGSAMTGWILAAVGYDATAKVQSAAVINGITFDFSWMGVILSAVLLIFVLLMDVEKYLPQIQAALGKKQMAGSEA